MAPVAVAQNGTDHSNGYTKPQNGHATTIELPMKPNGSLDDYKYNDLTPCIGREFPTANLVDMMNAPNSNELIAELALTSMENLRLRGVVWFRKQDNLTNDLQKKLILKIGELSGRPKTSGLHVHPVLNSEGEVGEQRDPDQEISTISSKLFSKVYGRHPDSALSQKKQNADQWHSDIAFEPVPADFSSLRLTECPKTGGDTLWASGYELYDRISAPVQKFLEGLTCTFGRPDFIAAAQRGGFKLYEKPRGAAENIGGELQAIHPVVRTNPVTGWKSLYPVGQHCQFINGVTEEESNMFLSWFKRLLKDNHDLQVRFHWNDPNDIAIWDNRCTFVHDQMKRFADASGDDPQLALKLNFQNDLPSLSLSTREDTHVAY
ncbi:uncharacterized protein LTR77_005213 [Saxophila tyrrhenica]|uniref:TauD/TfdA-like domain-containing protein n=1 Tax=Saxophila tyrrhenica TaxID=1690608 RepID=A0AAV9PB80_9PEZI|nr:hypothetical protein LTR77_005213 [Saxophila tyrrhenica]